MGEVFLQAPPPLISCWPEYIGTEYKVDSCNKKLQKKKRPLKEKDNSLYSPLNGIPLLGAILNVALSSYDIINWVKCLKIKQFLGVLSKVQISNKQRIGYYVIIQNYNKILKRDWLSSA